MVLESCIQGVLIETRWLYAAYPCMLRYTALPDVLCNIGPCFTCIGSDLNVTIIGTCINVVLVQRAFSNCKYGAVVFSSCVISAQSARFFLFLFALIVGSKVRRDTSPCVALV